MIARAALLLGCVLLPQNTHRGWVTSIAVAGHEVLSCSQAGVFRGTGDELALAWRVPFRPAALDVRSGRPRLLLVAGGRPAKNGMLALLIGEQESVTREIAEDLLYAVAIAPDGTRAVCGGADGRVRIVRLPSLDEPREVLRHGAPVRAVAFSGDGRWLASGGLDRLVLLKKLDDAGAKPAILEDHTGEVECVAFGPESALLASGARDGKVRLHTVAGRLVRTWQGLGAEVRALAWDRNAPRVYAALADGAVYLLDAKSGSSRTVRKPGGERWFSLAIRPDGSLVLGSRSVHAVERRG